ncbi:MAG: transcriptional repressor NrdR [Herpetosiphonaceae bacterium]|nr:MAG: transcriptional repressor NrdR [Herpetosiphonaceae bacterium]
MRCPYCQHPETTVIDTRKLEGGEVIRRRRKCEICEKRFTTYERMEPTLTVVKKNGEREPYDREKLMKGVRVACYKRPVPAAALERLANEVEAELIALDRPEIPSDIIGERVMARLREVDEVAYIRFASVYRAFKDIGTLREAVDELLQTS